MSRATKDKKLKKRRDIIKALILFVAGFLVCGGILKSGASSAYLGAIAFLGAGVALVSFLALLASIFDSEEKRSRSSIVYVGRKTTKSEKRNTIIISLTLLVIGVLIMASLIESGNDDFLSAIIIVASGMTVFACFWVIMAAVFD